MNWIKVEDIPMPDRGKFLVYLEEPSAGNRMHTAVFHRNLKSVGGCFLFDLPRITHYMELPEPPKEGEEE